MRVALYLRVSTKPRKTSKPEKPGTLAAREQSVENQRIKLREFAKAMSWDIAAEFEDRESGARADRAQFNAMMQAASRREFDIVLTWSLDRFSREGIFKTLGHLQRLADYKVGFRSYSESFLDTTAEFGEMLVSLFSFFASFERKRMIERTRAGQDRARAAGKRFGRPCKVFRRDHVRELAAQGLSQRAIATEIGISRGTVQNVLLGR